MSDPEACPCNQCTNHNHKKFWCRVFECEIDDDEPCDDFKPEQDEKIKVEFT